MFSPEVFATVFGVIFIAELPDKTAVAALVLATRHRALPVFAGTASALIVQSLIAVAAGGVLALLPPRPVHIGAGILFLVSAVSMWRSKDEEAPADDATAEADAATSSIEPSFASAFLKAFAVVFFAELGDLTQLGTAALAARFRSPVTVFAASASALCGVAALAVFLGNRLSRMINPRHVQRVAAVVFGVLGLGFVSGVI
ncbi:MAG TPA: TMEM165/GDT1 family protein [Polyangiaceae bacterium]|jgi:putative Ca2+/H+ antiporter (TMEM165/GDT1 family)|nr:TMEM165/GDT1 family protein [Polyangiaceae bacterium]